MDDAEDLHQQAVAATRENNHATALVLVARARANATDKDLLARLDITAAYAEAETGNLSEAIRLCDSVAASTGITPLTRGLATSQLGLLHTRNGDAEKARELITEAIALMVGEPEHLGVAHLNRGVMFLEIGDTTSAAADFTISAEQYGLAEIPEERAKAVYNLGCTEIQRNDLIAATRLMGEAGPTLAALSSVNAAIVEQDRAELLVASGRAHEAVEALETAAAAFGHEGLHRFQAESELDLARTLLSDDPARSRTVAQQAARRFAAQGSTTWAARARAAAVEAEVQDGATAKEVLTRGDALVAELRDSGLRPEADRLALNLARLAVRRKDLPDAAVRIAAVRVTTDSAVTTRLLAREVRAELAAAQGQDGRSLMYARKGLAELHSWQATFGSLDLQTSAAGHGQHLARLGLRGAVADGSAEVVFEWSERARALASRVSSLRPPPDPNLAADLTALRISDPTDHAAKRVLRERIRAHSWFAAQGTVGEPVDLATLQERLAVDDAALVAHIVIDGTITALAVTAKNAVVVRLGDAAKLRNILDRIAADLDFAAQNRTTGMGDAVRTSLRADLALVSDILIRPVLATIGYRRLVLTPSALLTGCPWTELPGLIGRPVTVPTSATQWLEQARRPFVGVREVGFLAGPRLTRAEEEVRRSMESWPRGHVLADAEADSTRAGWLAARVDLLHIAGHGSHPGDHPLFAAVELADGPWFGHDIDLLPRTPEVVILSACDLGRASVLHGEESVGMSAVWLHTGTRAVVSSLALLADDLACEVFATWHQLVAAGSAPADALAQVSAATDDIVPFLCFGAGW
ncbi:MAG TPA: CHAT domain-containing protein [Marmoricola sp.]|nr:CHAT domain-containing protein [Marmoricola sp.]